MEGRTGHAQVHNSHWGPESTEIKRARTANFKARVLVSYMHNIFGNCSNNRMPYQCQSYMDRFTPETIIYAPLALNQGRVETSSRINRISICQLYTFLSLPYTLFYSKLASTPRLRHESLIQGGPSWTSRVYSSWRGRRKRGGFFPRKRPRAAASSTTEPRN